MSELPSLLKSLKATCNLFYRWQFPCDGAAPKSWLIPLAGVIPGILLAAVASSLVTLLGRTAGGIASAILCALLMELLTGWRGMDALTGFLEQKLSGVPFEEALAVPAPRGNSRQTMILFFSIYGLRMLAFGILAASGAAVWYVFAFGGGYLVREILAETGVFHAPFLKQDETRPYAGWLLFAVSTLLAALLSLHFHALSAWVIAVMAVALIAFGARALVLSALGAANMRVLDIFGAASELVLLFAGLMVSGGF